MVIEEEKIDYRDCRLVIHIGDRTRISLKRHLFRFLIEEIKNRGFHADDLRLFNHLTIEAKASSLADELVDDAEFHCSDGLDEDGPRYISWEEHKVKVTRISVEQAVRGHLEEALREKKEEFLNPEGLENLDLLIGSRISCTGAHARRNSTTARPTSSRPMRWSGL